MMLKNNLLVQSKINKILFFFEDEFLNVKLQVFIVPRTFYLFLCKRSVSRDNNMPTETTVVIGFLVLGMWQFLEELITEFHSTPGYILKRIENWCSNKSLSWIIIAVLFGPAKSENNNKIRFIYSTEFYSTIQLNILHMLEHGWTSKTVH